MKILSSIKLKFLWFVNGIKKRGLFCALRDGFKHLFDNWYFDFKFGVETRKSLPSPKNEGFERYQATYYFEIRNLFKNNIEKCEHKKIIDIGCGKGKVIITAIECGFKEVVGIDFDLDLCLMARKNIEKIIGLKQEWKGLKWNILNKEASNYVIPDDCNVFFLFNPFQRVILKNVLENINESLERKSRDCDFIYVNPVNHYLLREYNFEIKHKSTESYFPVNVYYRNKH